MPRPNAPPQCPAPMPPPPLMPRPYAPALCPAQCPAPIPRPMPPPPPCPAPPNCPAPMPRPNGPAQCPPNTRPNAPGPNAPPPRPPKEDSRPAPSSSSHAGSNIPKRVSQSPPDLQGGADGRDDGSRRSNLRTDGLEETHGETGEQSIKVQAFLNEQLNLEDVPLDHVHRVGQPRDRRLRMILARFSRPADRDAATRNARKLRGSVFICEDLRPESQRLKKERYDDTGQIRRKNFPIVLSKLPIRDRQPSHEEPPLRPLLPPQPSPAVTRGPTPPPAYQASTIPAATISGASRPPQARRCKPTLDYNQPRQ
nr:serine/arginine repetitive matrix protein 1-like [Penaeus vannamei]